MKPISSAITTLQKAAPSKTGTQHGERGLATQGSSRPIAPKVSATDRIEAISSLTRFVKLVLGGSTNLNLDRARGLLRSVDGACDWNEASDHLSEFIDAYSQREVSAKVIVVRSSDFMRELNQYPTWAVLESFRWYKSAENKYRHAQPKPGDIAEHCHKLTESLRVSERMIAKVESVREAEK